MTLEKMIRAAASLPRGSVERRNLVSAIKVAVSPDTEDFVEWVLATQQPMSRTDLTRYLETKLGVAPTPAPAKGQSGRKTGDLEVGEKVKVDRNKNTNTLNTDACEQYHGRAGQITEKNSSGLVVQFYGGTADVPSADLTNEKQLFNGFASGMKTGLFRWTPRSDSQQSAESSGFKKIFFEVVYTRGGATFDPTRAESIERYVQQGALRGETRSTIYFTGPVIAFAENQQGGIYFKLSATQRGDAVAINPDIGQLLYIGVLGTGRPRGWQEEAVKLGLRAP